MTVDAARDAVLRTFQWESGHADVWRLFADAETFAAVVSALAQPWRDQRVTKVIGIESRGFLLGGAVAIRLGAGFVAVRKSDGLLPGRKLTADAEEDYRGLRHRLRMQDVLTDEDRVLLVDDWAERGSQAIAALQLVRRSGAEPVGVSLIVDQLDDATRASLGVVTSLVSADELGPSD